MVRLLHESPERTLGCLMIKQVDRRSSKRRQPCELCQQQSFEIIGDHDRSGHPLTTVVCTRCGLVSHETIPSDQEMSDYYAKQYRCDYHGQETPAAHRVMRAWDGGQWILRLLRPYVKPQDDIGEIGAGIGCTVKSFELAGYKATGIEPGHAFQNFAVEQLGAKISRRSLYDMPAKPTYDVILLVHVIEHFNAPSRALQHLGHLLRPGGRLYVECPNLAGPHAAPGKQFHFAHIYNFTPQTLVWLAAQHGFAVQADLTHRFDKSLRFIFRKADGPLPPASYDDGYSTTMRSLQRYSSLTYHLRPAYLSDRVRRDARFAASYFAANRRLRRLVRRCQAA